MEEMTEYEKWFQFEQAKSKLTGPTPIGIGSSSNSI